MDYLLDHGHGAYKEIGGYRALGEPSRASLGMGRGYELPTTSGWGYRVSIGGEKAGEHWESALGVGGRRQRAGGVGEGAGRQQDSGGGSVRGGLLHIIKIYFKIYVSYTKHHVGDVDACLEYAFLHVTCFGGAY